MPTFVMGDVHGERSKLVGLLRDAGLIDAAERWTGADAVLWFLGDFVDRGPEPIAVMDLVMRLEEQAEGDVRSLIGNHDAMLVSAHRFGFETIPGMLSSFLEMWERNGGRRADLARVEARHLVWICSLPAMAHADDHLLVHADALLYRSYGRTTERVNRRFRQILGGGDPRAWAELLEAFSERHAFHRDPDATRRFVKTYGGRRIVHGHTPIPFVADVDPATVTEPLLYADGLCVNVDGGMYAGGPGFLWELSADPDPARVPGVG